MKAGTSTAGVIDPDLQMLIDQAPPLDDDQRRSLCELLRPTGDFTVRTTHLPVRARSALRTEAA